MKQILLVEDDEDARALYSHQLKSFDSEYEIEAVESGEEGLEKISSKEYYCVLLDYWLKDTNASELLKRIQQMNLTQIPVVILTSVQDETLGLDLVNRGAQDYLIKKEVNGQLLNRAIEYAVGRHRLKLELEKSKEKEHFLAYHDALTSLPNRQSFFKGLNQALAQAKRNEQNVAVLFLDLDGFKQINDNFGHDFGDEVLIQAAKALENCIRKSDSIARLGGDEFTVVLNNVNKAQDVARVTQKILENLTLKIEKNGTKRTVTGSVGISLYPSDGAEAESLVKYADIAMYRAKKQGKNTYQFYDESMEAVAFERLALEAELKNALEKNEFRVHYQAQISLKDNALVGFEALLRWQHPSLGLLAPEKFLSLAEDTGLIIPIGEWVMRAAIKEFKNWLFKGFSEVRLTVNLSNKQFNHGEFIEMITLIISEENLDPKLFGIEITEKCAIEDKQVSNHALNALSKLGVHILIDDFGTGFSSLGYLTSLPIDILKIDHSFLDGVPADNHNSAIVSAVIAMAHQLDLQVLAEGVENEAQKEYLKDLNCDEYQGFLDGRPCSGDQFFPKWLKR